MKNFCFLFVAHVPGVKHETLVPADNLCEAYALLKRNAALTVDVPVEQWHLAKITSSRDS
jgi:hypothetical protein